MSPGWFGRALDKLEHKWHGAASALAATVVGTGGVPGYTVADYLLRYAADVYLGAATPAAS
jgi:hypothetical protein